MRAPASAWREGSGNTPRHSGSLGVFPYLEGVMPIITTADVAPWVQSTEAELDADPLALKALERVSLLVNEKTWGVRPDDVANYWTQATAPSRAKSIAEQVFARVYTNPLVLQREGVGPISETRAEIVLTGLELRPSELVDLLELRDDVGDSSGFWILSLADTDTKRASQYVPYIEAYQPRPGQPMGFTPLPDDYERVTRA